MKLIYRLFDRLFRCTIHEYLWKVQRMKNIQWRLYEMVWVERPGSVWSVHLSSYDRAGATSLVGPVLTGPLLYKFN